MRKNVFIFIIILFFAVFLFISGYVTANFARMGTSIIDTEEQALAFGISIISIYYPEFSNEAGEYAVKCIQENNVWVVFYYYPPTNGTFTLGGGLPEVKFREDGQIISIALFK